VGLQVSVLGRTSSGPIKTRNGLARLGISTLRLSTQGQLMHYYQFHIGDYRASTAHLSNEEDLAYRRLIDMYYDLEGPIPLDMEWVAKRIRVEPSVIRDVLNDMFTYTPDGYFHARCDQEIAHYRGKKDQASRAGKASAERRQNIRNASVEQASNGRSTDVQPTNNQEPITKNQQPETKVRNTRTSTGVECFDGVEPQVWEDWLAIRRAKKLPLTKTAMAQVEAEVVKAGISMQEALKECCLRGWGGFKASWLTREGGVTLNKQEALEARNRAVAQRWVEKMQQQMEANGEAE
jgi:uncharacterized protein YdaU (DUF1376 family)